MSPSHEWGDVDTFTTGAVGRPGQRVFFLQARANGAVVTLKCEKQQVQALGEYLGGQLADLPQPNDLPLPSTLELAEPLLPEFVVGPMGVAFDQENDRFVIAAEEIVPTDDEGEPDPEALEDRGSLRVLLTRAQARAFAERAAEVVAAGRPSCRWCGFPMDPDGHPCPRMN